MLSIGKLSAASVDYYTEQLSHSVGEDVPVLRGEGANRRVDYYADHRAPTRWMGSSLEAAGVDPKSPVTKEAFASLMGHETLLGESMTRARAAHGSVAAFDHALSAPKSVSLLYAFGDSQVRQQVREAHLEAVREAVEYMETHCAQARVGTRWRDDEGWHTSTRSVDSDGWVAAAFDHYTSRANDPQLHTHVVVINRVHTEDGWRALDGRRNYMHAKAGGTVYETCCETSSPDGSVSPGGRW
jgi:conjugative relaxase-like TrwC/TraI family protein